MPSQSRKHRGLRSQAVVAQWFKDHGWPFAESTGAGRSGADLTGTPGVAVEIKARTALNPPAWLRQAQIAAGQNLPCVIFRMNGQGEASVGEWGVMLTLAHFTELLRDAQYFPERP